MSKKKVEQETDVSSLPIVKAISIVKIPDQPGYSGWAAVEFTIQGEKILDIKAGEPNMKGIAIEEAKIKFVKNFYDEQE